MKRLRAGLLLISSAALIDCKLTCPTANPGDSCTFIGPDKIEDAGAPFETMVARSMSARPSAATVATWDALRARYQRAVTAAPERVAQALLAMRTDGSATLVRSNDARVAFARGAAIASDIAQARRAPTLTDMHAIHAAVVHGGGSLRGANLQVRAGDDALREYLPGALVAQAIADTFDFLGSPLAHSLEAPEVAAIIDQRLISVHPYADGNGRTSRLVADAILERDGFPPIIGGGSAALHWQKPAAIDARAHLERITNGMLRSVVIAETVV